MTNSAKTKVVSFTSSIVDEALTAMRGTEQLSAVKTKGRFSGQATAVPALTALPAFIDYLAEAALVVKADGSIACINAKAAQLLGHTQAALRGHYWPDFLVRRYQLHYQNLLSTALQGGVPSKQLPAEVAVISANGDIRDIELSVSCYPAAEPFFIVLMRDLTRYQAECAKLRTLAATDPLTALANRRYFDEMLQRYWDEYTSKTQPVSVVLVDVDYFKLFNDQFGHIQGDECLRRIAAAVSLALPAGAGVAARYGGEEFALLLPGYTEADAKAVALKVQHYVRQLDFAEQGLPEEVSVTVSVGIACELDGQFRTPLAMLCAADTALYRAKSEGRDCVNTSC